MFDSLLNMPWIINMPGLHRDDDDEMMVMMMMMKNCFCGMVDRRKAFSLISSRDHRQRSSPSRISDKPRAGFEPAQNLSSGFVEWSRTVVITTTPRRVNCILNIHGILVVLSSEHAKGLNVSEV